MVKEQAIAGREQHKNTKTTATEANMGQRQKRFVIGAVVLAILAIVIGLVLGLGNDGNTNALVRIQSPATAAPTSTVPASAVPTSAPSVSISPSNAPA
mmetsp:Transcript_21029/g.58501  ORF Transcript_21029/g.58501 Transcript_21029/m.58501 type:complete len:98 (-) Transcript_21029:573-866(-)